MEIAYHITVGHRLSPEQRAELEQLIEEKIETIDAIYNNWNPQSEISMLNCLAADERVAPKEELYALLEQIDRLHKLTGGRFDPTIEPLQRLWKSRMRQDLSPEESELEALRGALGWEKVHLEKGIFWKDHALTAIDLGGIAKGLFVDLLIEELAKRGYSHLYVEWGGELRVLGGHPSGRPWRIALQIGPSLELKEGAIASSGDCYQRWTIGSTTYTHLFNPLSLTPLTTDHPLQASSVLAPTCLVADAYATALMLFPSSTEALAWAASIPLTAWVEER